MHTTTTAAPSENSAIRVCALQTAREAIARWTGGSVTRHPVPDARHVTPQARWLAQTQRDLAAWISEGGFSQCEGAAPSVAAWRKAPTMFNLTRADACVD